MKKFFCHIGSEKCASTLIESVFHGTPDIRNHMSRHSVASLQAFHLEFRETQPFDSWQRRHETLRKKYIIPELSGPNDAVFYSEEAMLGLVHERGKPNQCDRRAKFLKHIVDGFEPHLIVLVRRQDGFIESMYNQMVKRGEMRPFKRYFATLPLENYEWDQVLDSFAAEFGADRIRVVPFDRQVRPRPAGRPNDVLNAIAEWIGLPAKFAFDKVPVMNPSLPLRFFPVQIAANRHLELEEAAAIADIMSQRFPKKPSESLGLFSKIERKKLLARFRDSNKRLFARYLKDYDSAWFLANG